MPLCIRLCNHTYVRTYLRRDANIRGCVTCGGMHACAGQPAPGVHHAEP